LREEIKRLFHYLTEIEIKATTDTVNRDPEKNGAMGATYIMAVNQCRHILEIILKDMQV
jgi:hypothetical protein